MLGKICTYTEAGVQVLLFIVRSPMEIEVYVLILKFGSQDVATLIQYSDELI